jgi:hypothetical protein
MSKINQDEEWGYNDLAGFVFDEDTQETLCQTWDKTENDYPNAKENGYRIAKLPALERQRDELRTELQRCRDLLAEMRDKHLASNAAVVRAYAQKRIEAADAAIAKAKEQSWPTNKSEPNSSASWTTATT